MLAYSIFACSLKNKRVLGVVNVRRSFQFLVWEVRRITAYKRCYLRALRAGRIACEGGPSVRGVNWEA